MKIIGLYEYDDLYQVVSKEEEDTVFFQGKYLECVAFIIENDTV